MSEPTTKTFDGKTFVAVAKQWPSDISILADIREAIQKGDGAKTDDFGVDYAVDGKEIVATFHDRNVRRADTSEVLAAIDVAEELHRRRVADRAAPQVSSEVYANLNGDVWSVKRESIQALDGFKEFGTENATYRVKGVAVTYSNDLPPESHSQMEVKFSLISGMATTMRGDAYRTLMERHQNGGEKPETITAEQWADVGKRIEGEKNQTVEDRNAEHLRLIVSEIGHLQSASGNDFIQHLANQEAKGRETTTFKSFEYCLDSGDVVAFSKKDGTEYRASITDVQGEIDRIAAKPQGIDLVAAGERMAARQAERQTVEQSETLSR